MASLPAQASHSDSSTPTMNRSRSTGTADQPPRHVETAQSVLGELRLPAVALDLPKLRGPR